MESMAPPGFFMVKLPLTVTGASVRMAPWSAGGAIVGDEP
jgi:hypothetical protein